MVARAVATKRARAVRVRLREKGVILRSPKGLEGRLLLLLVVVVVLWIAWLQD